MTTENKRDLLSTLAAQRKARLAELTAIVEAPQDIYRSDTTRTPEQINKANEYDAKFQKGEESWTSASEIDSLWGQTKQNAATAIQHGVADLANRFGNMFGNIADNRMTGEIPTAVQDAAYKEQALLQNVAAREAAESDRKFYPTEEAFQQAQQPLDQAIATGQLTPEEFELLDKKNINPSNIYSPERGMSFRDLVLKRDANRRQMERDARERTAAFEELNLYNNLDDSKEQLGADLNATATKYKDVSLGLAEAIKDNDAGKLVKNLPGLAMMLAEGLGDLVSNPAGLAQVTSSSVLPDLLLNAVPVVGQSAMLMSNIGYGLETQRKNLIEFEKEHQRPATTEEAQSMFMRNMTVSVAEQLGDVGLLKAFKKTGDVGDAVIANTTKDILKRAVARTGKVSLAGTREFTTEGYQAVVENDFGRLHDDPTKYDHAAIFESAMTGLGIGSGIKAGAESPGIIADAGRLVGKPINAAMAPIKDKINTALEAANERAAARKEEVNTRKQAEEAIKAQAQATTTATETVVAEPTVEPVKPKPTPETIDTDHVTKALDESREDFDIQESLSILHARNKDETVSLEEKQQNRASAIKLFANQLDTMEKLSEEFDAIVAPEGGKLSKTDTARKVAINKQLAAIADSIDPAANILTAIKSDTPKAQDVAKLVETVSNSTERSDEFTAATHSLLDAIATSDSAMDVTQAEQVVRSSSLTDSERNQITAFIDAKKAKDAIKSSSEVNQDVIKGSRGFLGLSQYRDLAMSSLVANDLGTAQEALDKLKKFASRHTEKFNTFSTAYAPLLRGNGAVATAEETAALEKVGTYKSGKGKAYISSGSKGFIDTMGQEVLALNAGVAEIEAAIAQRNERKTVKAAKPTKPVEQPVNTTPHEIATAAKVESTPTTDPKKAVADTAIAESKVDTNTTATSSAEVTTTDRVDDPKSYTDEAITEEELDYFDNLLASMEEEDAVEADSTPDTTTEIKDSEDTTITLATPESYRTEAKQEIAALYEEAKGIRKQIRDRVALQKQAVENLGNPVDIDTKSGRKRVLHEVDRLANKLKEQYTKTITRARNIRNNQYDEDGVLNKDTMAKQLTTQTDKNKEDVELAPTKDKEFVRNRVQVGFEPTMAGAKGRQSILQQLKNVIGSLAEDPSIVMSYVDIDELTDQHRNIIGQFVDFHKQAMDVFDNTVFEVKNKFKHKDYAQFLVNEDGVLPDNVKAAITAGMYTYIATRLGDTYFNDAKAINGIIGEKNEDAPVSPDTYNTFSEIGKSRSSVIASLGSEIRRNLGIRAKDSAPANWQSQLETSLGIYALQTLINMDLVDVNVLTQEEFKEHVPDTTNELSDDEVAKKEKREVFSHTYFIRGKFFKTEDGSVVTEGLAGEISEANKGSQQFFANLMQSEMAKSLPSFSKLEKVAETRDGTDQKVSDKEKEILKKHQDEPHSVALDTHKVFSVLDQAQQLDIGGFEADIENRVHIDNRKAAEGKNNGIARQLDAYNEFTDVLNNTKKGLKSAVYFAHSVWRQGRIGMSEQLINPQQNKLHRGLIQMDKWVNDVRFDDEAHIALFKAAVAQSVGIDIDKLTVPDMLVEFEAKMKDSTIAAGVEAIRNVLRGEEADTDAIVAAVKKGKEGTHTLHGLTNYAQYLEAQDAGKEKFTTNIAIEVDGITNGVMIGMLQFGASHPELNTVHIADMLRRGGMFFYPDETVGSYRKNKNDDSYESFEKEWRVALRGVYKKVNAKIKKRLTSSTTILKLARSVAKLPLMTTVYGSGKKALKRNISGQFIEKLYESFEKIANDSNLTDADKMKAFNKIASEMAIVAGVKPFSLGKSVKEVMNTPLDPDLVKALRNFVEYTYGEAAHTVIKTEYAAFLKTRTYFNQAVQYAAAATAILFKERLAAAEEAARNREENPLGKHDVLSKEEQASILEGLLNTQPIIRSLFSQKLDEGIYLGKSEKKPATDDLRYHSAVSFKLPQTYNVKNTDGSSTSHTVNSMEAHSEVETMVSPGVGPAILAIHNLDAFIAMMTMGTESVLNIHDGFYASINDVSNTAGNLNKHFLLAQRQADFLAEAKELLDRTLTTLDKEGSKSLTEYETEINKWLNIKKDVFKLNAKALGKQLDNEASAGKEVRNASLDAMHGINQYNLEGHGYKQETSTTLDELAAVTDAIGNRNSAEADAEKAKTKPTSAPKTKAKKETRTPPTTPDSVPTQRIQAYFASTDKPTIAGAVDAILAGDTKGISLQERAVIAVLRRLGVSNPNTKLLVNPDSFEGLSESAVKALGNKSNIGVYDPNTDSIVLRSTGYRSGLTLETLTHELVHAQVSRILQSDKVSKHTEDVKKELERLRNDVLKYAKDNRLNIPGGSAALKNVDEMLAWAFTNRDLQLFLSKVPVKGSEVGSVTTAFQKLVEVINKLLFKGVTTKNAEGDVRALMEIMRLGAEIMEEGDTAKQDGRFEASTHNVNGMTSEDLFNVLTQNAPNTSAEHKERLREINNTLTSKVAGVFESRLREVEERIGDSEDQFLTAMIEGKTPFTSTLLKAGFNLSPEEAYVAERIEAIHGTIGSEYGASNREFNRLWQIAKDNLTYKDFIPEGSLPTDPGYKDEVIRAKRQHKALFHVTPTVTKHYSAIAGKEVTEYESNYLSRFIAMAVASEQFRKKLDGIDGGVEYQELRGKSFGGAMEALLNNFLEFVSGLLAPTRIGAGSITSKLDTMMEHLAQIESRKRYIAHKEQLIADLGERTGISDLLESGKDKLVALVNSEKMKSSKSKVATASRVAVNLLMTEKMDLVLAQLLKVRDRVLQKRHGAIANMVTEMRGITDTNKPFWDLLRHSNRDIDQKRAQVREWTASIIRDAFKNKLTKEDEDSLTKAAIELDLGVLLDDYKLAEISDLLTNTDKLKSEIRKLRGELRKFKHGNYFMNQAEHLGHFIATGIATSANQMRNAQNIAYLAGTDVAPINEESFEAMAIIDKLATLYGIENTATKYRKNVAALIKAEGNSEQRPNGVEFVLRLQRKITNDARDQIFGSEDTQMAKGYAFQITDPNRSVRIGSKEDAAELLAAGWVPVSSLKPDSRDYYQDDLLLFTSDHNGVNTFSSGIISTTSKLVMGTRMHERHTALAVDGAYEMRSKTVTHTKRKSDPEIAAMFNSDKADLSIKHRTVPTLRRDGTIQDYRYMMSKDNRDELLNRNNRIADVLGAGAANIIDKVNSKDINEKTIDALHDQYKLDFKGNEVSYAIVGAGSTDPKLRELWDLLPKETKDYVKSKWGEPQMLVRNELLDLVFGYRKMGVTNIWDTPEHQRSATKAAIIRVAESIFGTKAASRFKTAERAWIEIVGAVKDILVIKTGLTLLGNIISNLWLLKWSGVPVADIVRDSAVGWKGAIEYHNAQKRQYEIETLLSTDLMSRGQQTKLRDELQQLRVQMSNNPTKELIEAGVFQTIIEDVNQLDDPYSYKTNMTRWIDTKTQGLPGVIKSAANVAVLSHSTSAYKMLSQSTQISDFSSRYVKFKYLTQVQNMDKQEAIDIIMEDFINYDVPTSRGLQYMNEIGFIMFSKYFLRVQKPILRLFKERPAASMALVMGHGLFDLTSPLDYSMGVGKSPLDILYNPVTTAMGSIDEPAPINIALAILGK